MGATKSEILPILFTSRLELRALKPSDSDEVFVLRTDKTVNKYIDRPSSGNDNLGLEFINKITKHVERQDVYYWGLTLRDAKKIIGTICLWNFNKEKTTAEIGFDLMLEYHGKGLMTEALKTVLNFGFNSCGLVMIEAFTHKKNTGAISLLNKHGFLRDTTRVDDNNIIFTKTND